MLTSDASRYNAIARRHSGQALSYAHAPRTV
ncbi:hypothetical protein RCH10_005009 [Variovorax sp. GrIS 2.14]